MPVLSWLSREDDLKCASQTQYRLLEELPKLSYGNKNTGNMLIQGDNLEALKALLPFYAGQVKCIYIDPPYNTGSAFEHYDDNLEHSKWLSIMYPRLELLRELMAEDGSIWISIDDDEGHYLKVICDEIFGRKNFITTVSWHRNYASANDAKTFAKVIDFIFVYQKSKFFKRNLLPRTDKQNILYKYDSHDGKGLWRSDNLSVKTYSANYDYPIVNPNTGISFNPPKGRCWMTNSATVHKWIKESRIFFGQNGNGAPQLKRYLNEVQEGIVPITYWSYDDVGHNDESRKELKTLFPEATTTLFSTPKPERLIQRILTLASSHGDLILDSFLGSGTTAAVATKMRRRFIGIEMGEHAQTHCAVRLQKVIDGERGGVSESVDWQGGGGFQFFQLGEPVFDSEGRINNNIKFCQLAAHIWFYETKTPFNKSKKKTSPFLGVHDGTAYALLYNGILHDRRINGGNVLTTPILDIIINDAGNTEYHSLVIYGEYSRIGEKRLKANKIVFKQIPYDLKIK
jgi:adenine-specific DNA-methyltransferase